MKRGIALVGLLFFCLSLNLYSQDNFYEEGIEVYLIDAYVTHEAPYKLVLSFFTSDSCTSSLLLSEKYQYIVSDKLTDDHKLEVDISGLQFDSAATVFEIGTFNKSGEEFRSEIFELLLPFNNKLQFDNAPGIFEVCCFGGIIFGIPSPTFISRNGNSHFGLAKEIPLISYYSMGYNYPAGYISLEYEYVFNADIKHFLRTGYKHIFQIPVFEYISPGVGVFSDWHGYNGISAEFSLGLFRITNVFTIASKYRYNFQPGKSGNDFHEISVGLYSNFFSLNF